jgi:hypothetical protein
LDGVAAAGNEEASAFFGGVASDDAAPRGGAEELKLKAVSALPVGDAKEYGAEPGDDWLILNGDVFTEVSSVVGCFALVGDGVTNPSGLGKPSIVRSCTLWCELYVSVWSIRS